MSKDRETVFLIWEVRTNGELGLRGIMTTKENAEIVKQGLEKWDKRYEIIDRRYIIESVWLDHIFGFQDIRRTV